MTQPTNWSEVLHEVELLDPTEGDFPERPELRVDIADGGYLSWLYGSSTIRHGAWPPKFTGQKPLIVMDSRGPLLRKIRDATYKQARERRRDQREEMDEKTNVVRNFRKFVEEEDGRFRFIRVEGLEADDLVALADWCYGSRKAPVAVMGVDKDFFQLKKTYLIDKDGNKLHWSKFQVRLPLALQGTQWNASWQPLVTLALYGDKSDSVPRLLAPRTGLALLAEVYKRNRKDAFELAYQHFGARFLTNLYSVILPDPEILGITPAETYDLVLQGKWNADLLHQLPGDVYAQVKSWNLSPSKI